MFKIIARYTRFVLVLSCIPLSIFVFTCCSQKATVATTKSVNPPVAETAAKGLALTGDSFRIAFYNVENLFDIYDDPITQDSEYLPTSKIQWTQERYDKKLVNITKVIESMGFPSILGMAEIENRKVLEDLINQPLIKANNYNIAHFESPDERGIDVAMIYKKGDFDVKNMKYHRIKFNNDNDKTRDILEVTGILRGLPLTVFVNHWPSKSGGAAESETKRVQVADKLKSVVDAIFQKDKNTKIIIMGDLNDEPTDISLRQSLGAIEWLNPNNQTLVLTDLYNLASAIKQAGLGSYYYKKHWETIDQIIVSGNFLSKNSTLVTEKQQIFDADFLTYLDKSTGIKAPNRTYTGPIYRGGYSDHFPVFIQVYLKK
jgi:predicted extracellular nuclease